MSSSPLIPKEKLSAYQRWELHAFDGPPQAAPAAEKKAAEAEKVRHLHRHAYDAGRADGLRDGAETAAHEVERLRSVLAAIERQTGEAGQDTAQHVLDLALEIARQMVRQALKVRPELIVPLVNEALERAAPPHAAATIALNPADAVIVREHLVKELAAGGWRVIEDPAVQAGGALLQTAATQIDATLGTRWKRLAAALGVTDDWLA